MDNGADLVVETPAQPATLHLFGNMSVQEMWLGEDGREYGCSYEIDRHGNIVNAR